MQKMELKERAKKLLEEGKVRRGPEGATGVNFEVDKDYVKIFQKPGRTLVSCSCKNHPRFVLEQPLCKHKLAAIKFWMDEE